MKGSAIVPILVSFLAIGGAMAMFQTGATPYITVAEARKLSGDRLNRGVEIDKSTVRRDLKNHILEFDAKDRNGEKIHVKHVGEYVDFSKADKVTCIGKLEGDTFVSQQMLVKCPSKYEEENKKK